MIGKYGFLVLILAASVGWATEFTELHAYRDVSGEYTAASVGNLRTMARVARGEGHIDLWVTFDMDFTGDPAQRTPEVVQQEEQAKQRLINAVIVPLGREASLLEVPSGLAEAPGCLVRATPAGLRGLAKSEHVKHMSWYAPS